jgi:hypothetical protein
MKLGRNACLAGLVALGAWSLTACSSDNNSSSDAGTDGGGAVTGSGGSGTGGKGGAGGATGGTAGKGGTGGTAGSAGSAGSAGKKTDGGEPDSGPTIIDGGFDGGTPSVKITDPDDLETVSKDSEYTAFPKFPVAFKVGNFELAPPGTGKTCAAGVCGHVHLNIDGIDCNTTGAPYNNAAASSPVIADLGLCKGGVAGAHTLVLSLHNDDHSDVKVGGVLVSSTITITAKAGDAGVADAGDGG